VLIFPAKQRIAQVQLSDYTAKAPNIYFTIVGHSQNHLRRTIVSALNVSVDSLALEATWTEINYFDSRFIHFLQKNVFWLKVSMNDLISMQKMYAIEYLKHKSSD